MSELAVVFFLSLLAGAAMPFGAFIAKIDTKNPTILGTEWRHFIVAIGGGALISAIAFVLVPEGSSKLSVLPAALSFALGGGVFCLLDLYLSKAENSMGQLVAMLSDFIPEAIALGTAFATGKSTGFLIAALIVFQNIPEGFNAFEEVSINSTWSHNKIIMVFGLLSLAGPTSALIGYNFIWLNQSLMGMIMLFASGGILYLVFEDIAPGSKITNRWMPALGAVFGFVLGLVGHMIIGG